MASASRLDEFREMIAERGIARSTIVSPAPLPPELAPLRGLALPAVPLAVAVDVYGTLLSCKAGEIGLSADFLPDTAKRVRAVVAADHRRARAKGIPWPEVDAPSVFARALALDREGGEQACVAWECANNACFPMPGAAEFLACCRDRALPLGIVSNAQFYTPLFLEAAFGAPLVGGDSLGFDPELLLWSYEIGRAKPDRFLFDALATRLGRRGIPPQRVLYVGNDALNDSAAAGEAGFMTALFAGDAASFKPRLADPRVSAHPPSTVVVSWEELKAMVFAAD